MTPSSGETALTIMETSQDDNIQGSILSGPRGPRRGSQGKGAGAATLKAATDPEVMAERRAASPEAEATKADKAAAKSGKPR